MLRRLQQREPTVHAGPLSPEEVPAPALVLRFRFYVVCRCFSFFFPGRYRLMSRPDGRVSEETLVYTGGRQNTVLLVIAGALLCVVVPPDKIALI